jgi:hypothetical protein
VTGRERARRRERHRRLLGVPESEAPAEPRRVVVLSQGARTAPGEHPFVDAAEAWLRARIKAVRGY